MYIRNLYECGVTDVTAESMSIMFMKSPISRVRQAKAPTLFIIGSSDKRVPPSQSLEMYYALKELGVPTKYDYLH